MIRDKLVVGLRDAKLSEKLQFDSELTLEKAVNQARQSEAVKKQQHILKGEGSLGWRVKSWSPGGENGKLSQKRKLQTESRPQK